MIHMDALDMDALRDVICTLDVERERRARTQRTRLLEDLTLRLDRARVYERTYASLCAEAVLDGGLDADRWAARWRDSRALADEWQQQLRDTLRDQS